MLRKTSDWLETHKMDHNDGDLKALLNRNLFLAYFYSTAKCLDTDDDGWVDICMNGGIPLKTGYCGSLFPIKKIIIIKGMQPSR